MAEEYDKDSIHVHSIPEINRCEDNYSAMVWEIIMECEIKSDNLQRASALIANEMQNISVSFDYKGNGVVLMTVKFSSYTEGWRSTFRAMRLLEKNTCTISMIQGEPVAAWHMQFVISEL
jgi:hypothetical protein